MCFCSTQLISEAAHALGLPDILEAVNALIQLHLLQDTPNSTHVSI